MAQIQVQGSKRPTIVLPDLVRSESYDDLQGTNTKANEEWKYVIGQVKEQLDTKHASEVTTEVEIHQPVNSAPIEPIRPRGKHPAAKHSSGDKHTSGDSPDISEETPSTSTDYKETWDWSNEETPVPQEKQETPKPQIILPPIRHSDSNDDLSSMSPDPESVLPGAGKMPANRTMSQDRALHHIRHGSSTWSIKRDEDLMMDMQQDEIISRIDQVSRNVSRAEQRPPARSQSLKARFIGRLTRPKQARPSKPPPPARSLTFRKATNTYLKQQQLEARSIQFDFKKARPAPTGLLLAERTKATVSEQQQLAARNMQFDFKQKARPAPSGMIVADKTEKTSSEPAIKTVVAATSSAPMMRTVTDLYVNQLQKEARNIQFDFKKPRPAYTGIILEEKPATPEPSPQEETKIVPEYARQFHEEAKLVRTETGELAYELTKSEGELLMNCHKHKYLRRSNTEPGTLKSLDLKTHVKTEFGTVIRRSDTIDLVNEYDTYSSQLDKINDYIQFLSLLKHEHKFQENKLAVEKTHSEEIKPGVKALCEVLTPRQLSPVVSSLPIISVRVATADKTVADTAELVRNGTSDTPAGITDMFADVQYENVHEFRSFSNNTAPNAYQITEGSIIANKAERVTDVTLADCVLKRGDTYDAARLTEEAKLEQHLKYKKTSSKKELLAKYTKEEQILSNTFVDKNVVEAHLHTDRIQEEAKLTNILETSDLSHERHLSAIRTEETILNAAFVDKNVVDDDYRETRLREEARLKELATKQGEVHVNHAAAEEERLKGLMEDKDGLDAIDYGDSPEISPPHHDQEILDVARALESTNVKQTERIMDMHDNLQKSQSHKHRIDRDVEDARFRDMLARREASQTVQSEQLLQQHARPNLRQVANVQLARRKFTTQTGLVNFDMSDSCSYHPQPNTYCIPEDCSYDQQATSHDVYKDCVLVKDAGLWYLVKDVQLENVVNGVDDFKTFSDGTAPNVYQINKDSVIVNKAEKHDIATSASMDAPNISHLLPTNYNYSNTSSHRWSLDASVSKHRSAFSLCKEGVRVQRTNAFSIPLPNNTEFQNRCWHFIPESGSVVNRSKGLDMYKEGMIVQKRKRVFLCDTGQIVQKGKSYSLPAGGSQDKQDRKYSIPVGGSQDHNNPSYSVPVHAAGVLVKHRKSHDVPVVSPGDMRQNNRHSQPDCSRYSPWGRSSFDIYRDARVVDEHSMDVYKDCSHQYLNNTFDLNAIEVDEEYLNEENE